MLYELSVVAKSDLGDKAIDAVKKIVTETMKSYKGEILVEDDWGKKYFAQPTKTGIETGHFLYFIFRTDDNQTNVELARRFKITEEVLRSLVIKLSDDNDQAGEIVKNLKTPYSKKYAGSVTDLDGESDGSIDKDRRRFAKRKACWFTANKIKADWKDPQTFSWLINEFGKISPARISGISRKHQRFANDAIKRARQIGLASNVSSRMAE